MTSAFAIIALVMALAATVLAFIFIVPEKKGGRKNVFAKFLHDTVNFKYLIVEKILQAFYILLTAYAIILGFLMLFSFQRYWGEIHWNGGRGLIIMIGGPIAIRLVYEFMMMFILLVKNVIQINSKLKAADNAKAADVFAIPELKVEKEEVVEEVVEEAAPQAGAFCPSCGTKVEGGAFCPKCGTKL